ncbi:MAG TPA: nucleotide sugar dehydrogenase [Acidimicrobiales bacterium]|nr:nucleotide sugar dehydrogenase [Acidimicrobiales bacterium]
MAVVGLGAIGLPVAAELAARGHRVVGCDVDPQVTDAVAAGRDPHGREPGLGPLVERLVRAGLLHASTDTAGAVAGCQASIVLVPLLLGDDDRPDYSALDAATEAIGSGMRSGHLVVFETTVPVGDTRLRLAPLLEKSSGMTAGVDFHVAFSPERVLVGRVASDLRSYPKVVGGIDPRSGDLAESLYADGLGVTVVRLESAEAAELAKLAETTYRSVNIGLANELAAYCEEAGIDLPPVIAAANSQPFSHIHQPGIGVGGHCIPVYPYFWLQGLGAHPDGPGGMTRAALATNERAPVRCVARLERALGGLHGCRVAVLGWGYREGSGDARFSVAREVARLLRERGASVLGHDSRVPAETLAGYGVEPVDIREPVPVDAVVVQAAHREYASVGPHLFPGCRAVLDGRNGLDPEPWARAGVTFLGVGRPARPATGGGPA